MVRHGAVTADGRGEVVTGIVMMLLGANSREVSEAVAARLAEIQPTLPEGVTLETHYDRRELVDRTIRTVATNLIEGGVLVVIVLLLLLGNLRGGLLVATAIPLSMLFAFIGMNWAGVSGNLMSLGAIDFGLIVDGSVVIIEHVVFVLSRRQVKGDATKGDVLDGAADVASEQLSGLPMLRVQVDRRAIARHGINAADVLDTVAAIGGHQVGEVFEGQRRFALLVRFSPDARRDLAAIERIPISSSTGAQIPLGQLAEISEEVGPAQISRENVQRRVTIQANVRGRDLGSFVAEARERVRREVELPAGYFIAWGGQFENLREASCPWRSPPRQAPRCSDRSRPWSSEAS